MSLDCRPEELAIIEALLARWLPGRRVMAFGSRATGRAKPYSDLDLVVMDGEPIGLSEAAAIAEAFDESPLPFKVDLVHWNAMSPTFRQAIEPDLLPFAATTRP